MNMPMTQNKDSQNEHDLQQDSAWSWIVAAAAFTAHLITHGIVYSFGVLFLTIQDTFQGTTKTQISWIPSLTTGTLYLIGPLAGILINRYGCRTVTILGSLLGCVGYFLSVFVRELHYLYITLGVLAGCGFGMVFLPSILIVTRYFKKYRALACGFALSGAGGGAFVFSPLLEHLVGVYAWRGALLLLSAIILNCIPCGLIYHSLSKTTEPSYTKAETKDIRDVNSQEETFHLVQKKESNNACLVLQKDGHAEVTVNNGITDSCFNENNSQNRCDCNDKEIPSTETRPITIEIVKSGLHGNVYEINYNFKETDGVIDEAHVLTDNDGTNVTSQSACTRYITLFKRTEVTVFFVSQFLFFSGLYLPFIYLPDKATGHAIPEQNAAWIASTIGISSITGRIVLGYLADRHFVNRMVMFKTALLVTGVSTSLLPALNTLWLLLIYAVIYGISTGITLSLTSVVLVDIAGIELLSDAMGLNNLFSAFGALLGPPVAGLLYDKTHSYTASFLASGLSMTVSGLMLIFAATICHKPK